MSDNIFTAVLTFSLMAAGTAAIGAEMLGAKRAPMAVATLPAVTVIGHRLVVADALTLPMVMVTGRRDNGTAVAVENAEVAQRVQ